MTARLGSEYRYFGKLVLVPFRYFSIDTYRNIDIFDNTSNQTHFLLQLWITNTDMHINSLLFGVEKVQVDMNVCVVFSV